MSHFPAHLQSEMMARAPSFRVRSRQITEFEKERVVECVRIVPDFPKPGIAFKDLSLVLGDPLAYQLCIDVFVKRYAGKGITAVVGIECNGFVFAAPISLALDVPFVPFRKPGKLPCKSIGVDFQTGAGIGAPAFGADRLEMHEDALRKGAKVLIVDDMLGTGATLKGACELVEKVGGQVVECACCVAMSGLGGRELLAEQNIKLFTVLEDFMEDPTNLEPTKEIPASPPP
uniref:adenine phosphoribosyltransferase n=1 Tax=Hemiselmis tepida TaxID=464990 RepID=A0A7S0YY37_9CRYP|mmetsp:Transcript_35767/g.91330  ORF Transcript_35767/g.91330 Transcript_35767/m.91330 type:complete len:231 (+) Transcript_35767:31-723(+)